MTILFYIIILLSLFDIYSCFYISYHKNKMSYFSQVTSETENAFEDMNQNNEEIKIDNTKDMKMKKPKRIPTPKPVKVSKKELTGYQFKDNEGEYDVPFIDEPMWYRLSVRKNSEKKLCENMIYLRKKNPIWQDIFYDAFYPQTVYVKFKGNDLALGVKPVIPGIGKLLNN